MPAPEVILDFLNEIEENYLRAKENRASRMDITWGKWSRGLNLRMRGLQNDVGEPTKTLLLWLFMYWINRSQLLEIFFQHRLTHHKHKRKLQAEGDNIKTVIMSGDPIGPPGQSEQIQALLSKVGEEFNKSDDEAN